LFTNNKLPILHNQHNIVGDPRQVDGLGGADSLTAKVGIVSPPTKNEADIDYLFMQVVF